MRGRRPGATLGTTSSSRNRARSARQKWPTSGRKRLRREHARARFSPLHTCQQAASGAMRRRTARAAHQRASSKTTGTDRTTDVETSRHRRQETRSDAQHLIKSQDGRATTSADDHADRSVHRAAEDSRSTSIGLDYLSAAQARRSAVAETAECTARSILVNDQRLDRKDQGADPRRPRAREVMISSTFGLKPYNAKGEHRHRQSDRRRAVLARFRSNSVGTLHRRQADGGRRCRKRVAHGGLRTI